MATSRILLPLEIAVLPTTNPATLTKVTSGGAPPTNAPAVTYNVLAFNAAVVEATKALCRRAERGGEQHRREHASGEGQHVTGRRAERRGGERRCAGRAGRVLVRAGLRGTPDA